MPIIGGGPYDGYLVYGPYWHKKEGRFMMVLIKDGARTSTSRARYVMSMHLGILVPSDMDVDHIDGDKTNDQLKNLQILDKYVNNVKTHNGCRTLVELVCPWCEKPFTRRRGQTHLVKGGKRTFCCVKCARAYQFRKK